MDLLPGRNASGKFFGGPMDELITTTDAAYARKVRRKQSLLIGLCITVCNFAQPYRLPAAVFDD